MDNNLHLPTFKPINILIDGKYVGSCPEVNFEKTDTQSNTISIVEFKRASPLKDDFMINLLEEACESFEERLERYYYQRSLSFNKRDKDFGLLDKLDLVLFSYMEKIDHEFKKYYGFSTTDKKALREQYYYVLDEFTNFAENLIGEGEV